MTVSVSREEEGAAENQDLAAEMRGLARRAHHHYLHRTTDQADSPMQLYSPWSLMGL